MWSDPFRFWTDVWAAGAEMTRTSVKFGEMAQASAEVIESRSRSIAAACRDPLGSDYRELARMVPEKLAAFQEAGAASLADIQAFQAAAMANWQQMTALAISGRPPSTAAMNAFANRTSQMAKRASAAGGKALAPVHSRATANARRLRKKPRP